ncbi:hypothetical protein ACFSYH_01435 [Populibacterium corticicola]|uniref:Uncharacterized protein n=1 Tax=Populibacterium corticicola TaxID=1812826 RepID=A0ABW5XDG7_9MICO
MSDTRIELNFYLPDDGSLSPTQIVEGLAQAGFLGAVNRAATDVHSVEVVLLAKFSERGVVVPRRNGESVVLASQTNLEAFVQELAHSSGASVSGLLNALDAACYAEGPHTESAPLDDDAKVDEPEGTELRRIVFATYGEDRYPALSAQDQLTPLAHEISLHIGAPVTAVNATATGAELDPTLVFAEGVLTATRVFANYRPIVEVEYDGGIFLRWYSADRATGSVRQKLLDIAAERNGWYLPSESFNGEPFVPLAQPHRAESDTTVPALFDAQTQLIAQLNAENLDPNPDLFEVLELTRAIGLPDTSGHKLAELLSIRDRIVEVSEVCATLHFPDYVAEVLKGRSNPKALPGAVHVEQGTAAGSANFKALLERPEGTSVTDRMRQLDFDRPALALLIEVGMVAAGIALIVLGIMDVGPFGQTWIAIVGYLLGAWLFLDGVASLFMWAKIRRQNKN